MKNEYINIFLNEEIYRCKWSGGRERNDGQGQGELLVDTEKKETEKIRRVNMKKIVEKCVIQ